MANSPALEIKGAKPLSRYAPFRRAGDLVFFAGIIAVNHATMKVVTGYSDLPTEARRLAGETGELSTDMKDGPIAAQSWWILNSLRRTVEAAGGTLNDVVKMTQYFRNLRDFPAYNRIRDLLRQPAREHGCSDFGIAADLGFAA